MYDSSTRYHQLILFHFDGCFERDIVLLTIAANKILKVRLVLIDKTTIFIEIDQRKNCLSILATGVTVK